MKKGSWVLNDRTPKSQYDEGDSKPWRTPKKGDVLCHSPVKFSCCEGSCLCFEVVVERGRWDSETAVWVSLWEAGWDVGIWPHFYAGAPTRLSPAGLSSIPDTPAKLSKAYSVGHAIVPFFFPVWLPLAVWKCFLISNLWLLSFNLCSSLVTLRITAESPLFSSNLITLLAFPSTLFLDL